MSVVGLAKILKMLESEQSAYSQALDAALYQEGLQIIAASVKITPKDFGVLRASHYAAPPTTDHECEIGFGTDYALPVHDRVEVFHKIGQPLYLKRPVDEAQSGYVDRIANRTRANHKAGIGVKSIPKTAPTRPKDGKK